MFHSKRTHPDIKKNTQKFLDHKKESLKRLQALVVLIECFDDAGSKVFFQGHYSEIFYVFHDAFTLVEAGLKQKGHKSQKDDLESVLLILEKVLLLLPELVNRRWQFHSIGRIVCKLLHYGNVLKLRIIGLRLFMLWFQALQGNADEMCHCIYGSILPGFPSPVLNIDWERCRTLSRAEAEQIVHMIRGPKGRLEQLSTSASQPSLATDKDNEGWCHLEEILPLFPVHPTERLPSLGSLTKVLLDRVLDCMSTKLVLIQWDNPNMKACAFHFLFENFKKYYLPHIFPDWKPEKPLYKPVQEVQPLRTNGKLSQSAQDSKQIQARESVLRWFVAFTNRFRRTERSSDSVEVDSPVHTNNPAPVTSTTLTATANVSLGSESVQMNKENLHNASEIIRSVLYSTKENVQLLHEVFRQGFMMPPENLTTIKQVLSAYQEWIKLPDRPAFMLEPDASPCVDFRDSGGLQVADSDVQPQSPVRSESYCCAVDIDRQKRLRVPSEEVRAGLQANLRLFILHAAEVFLVYRDCSYLEKQVDVCKRVIHLYRAIVLEVAMDTRTWEQLLCVLLEVCEFLLSSTSPKEKDSGLAGQLVGCFLQTLFVTWIRANLIVTVGVHLWDKCLEVLSSLTQWEEVVTEWSTTLETLTRIMSRTVYGLDMGDLPLDRLSEQKYKRRRHLIQGKPRLVHQKSFSRWSRMEHGSPKPIRAVPAVGKPSDCSPVAPSAQKAPAGSSPAASLISAPSPKESPFVSSAGSAFESPHGTAVTAAPSVAAGSATTKDSASPGRRPEDDCKETEVNPKQPGTLADAPSCLVSDEESTDSEDLPIKSVDPDGVSDISTSSRSEDVRDACMFRAQLKTQLNSDGYLLSRQDTGRSMEWYGTSMDLEVSQLSHNMSDTAHLMDRINESNLEPEDDDEEKTADGDDTGSRSSPPLLGREDAVAGSRTPSPPLALSEAHDDLLEFDESEDAEPLDEEMSVVLGGTKEGWGPVSAVALWRRMLGILGNVNKIQNPAIHAKVFDCLTSIWNMLDKIRLNQGISLDNKSTPPMPDLLPPLQFFVTWVFEAASLSMENEFKSGRLLAYQLMCVMTMRRQDAPLSKEYLTHFYRLMHIGLTGTDQDIISAIVSNCSHFFSVMLPSSSLLILDFIQAANTISASQNMKLPRAEAVTLLGSLICYPNVFTHMALHQPGHPTNEFQPNCTVKDIKEKLVSSLLRVAKLDPCCAARCTALNAIGVYVVEELVHSKGPLKVPDCISVLLASITFYNKSISSVACDMIRLLSEFSDEIEDLDRDMPLKIVDVLCNSTVNLLPGGDAVTVQEENKILVSVLLCLLDWVMVIPVSKLLAKKCDNDITMLSRVFKVLKLAASNKSPKKRRKSLNISSIIGGDGKSIRLARLQDGTNRMSSALNSPFDALDSGDDLDSGHSTPVFDFPDKPDPVKLTAKSALMHVVNHLGHFPLGAGPSRLDSAIGEHEDNSSVETDELSSALFSSPNVQFFVLNETLLISMVEIHREYYGGVPEGVSCSQSQVRLILRDMSGKHAWDYTLLHGPLSWQDGYVVYPGVMSSLSVDLDSNLAGEQPVTDLGKPAHEDHLNEVLRHIGSTSRECLLFPDQALNEPAPSPDSHFQHMEDSVMAAVLDQHVTEEGYVQDEAVDDSLSSIEFMPPALVDMMSPFQLCHLLLSESGIMTWEKRARIDLLKKDERFLRELKHLDNTKCRETHKIAVLYVAEGQEDKTSILSNSAGSQAYEDFVSGLAWEVDLSTHTGFLGGLERNLSTGATAPYYANSTMQVVFHVSTRMPLPSDATSFNKKVRHLGNDEVHIVWSEHYRDYRHGIVNTEFGDVLIAIYPLRNHLFRIKIIKKPEVPCFGPLFDGAVVDRRVLPSLVRATAINASRARREMMPLYERYYEERHKCIETIVQTCKEPSTFEDFAARVFSPAPDPANTSKPCTPAVVRHGLVRGQTVTSDGVQKSSKRTRSKSSVIKPTIRPSAKLKRVSQDDMAVVGCSVLDGLDEEIVSTTDGGPVRQDKKRLSLRWRNKHSPGSTLVEDSD